MATRKFFHDSVTELPPQPGPAGNLLVKAAEPAHLNDSFTLNFALQIPDASEKELARRVEAGERVPAAELDSKYALTAADTAPLKQWLTKNGYTSIRESSDHTNVFANASADTVAKSLQVDIVRVTKKGITHTAARNVPSLPSDIGDKVKGFPGFNRSISSISIAPFARRLRQLLRLRLPPVPRPASPRRSFPRRFSAPSTV